MFDILKKKISGFVENLTKKKEEPEEREAEKPREIPEPEPKPVIPVEEKPEPLEEEIPEPEPAPVPKEKPEKKPEPVPEKKAPEPAPPKKKPVEKKAAPKPVPEKVPAKPVPEKKAPEKKPEPAPEKKVEPFAALTKKISEVLKKEEPKPPEPKKEKPPPKKEEKPVAKKEPPAVKPEKKPEPPKKKEVPKPAPKPEAEPVPEAPARELSEEKKKEVKLGAITQIKSMITREVEIREDEVSDLLDALELEMLEGDVDMEVAESIRQELSEKLIGSKIKRSDLQQHVKKAIRETLVDMMENEKAFDLLEKVKSADKPFRIVFLGINGAGKTTTIAKFAKLLMDNGYSVVFAAADTFRAAAIEQMGVHATRLGVKLIKRDYGADPTSVAYDATSYAKAHGIDVVLIDTAGRQDTNINLINELKKMDRVLEPELKIYIGESISGSVIIEQVSSFNSEIGVDGVVLTKLDCDPKGGTVLSLNRATGVPVLFIGTGQEYKDLEKFEAERIADRLLA